MRLDEPGFRDATYVLWLAARELNDPRLRQRAENAVEELLLTRVADARSPGRDLWLSAYNLDGTPLSPEDAEDWHLAGGIDLQASRYAIQALLAASLMGDADATAPALREATAALRRLPQAGGRWQRHYALRPRAIQAPSQAAPDEPPPAPPDETADAPPEPPAKAPPAEPGADDGPPRAEVFKQDAEAGKFPDAAPGVAEVLAAMERAAELGPEKYRDALAAESPVEHRLAKTVCGLDDDALTREAAAPGVEPAGLLDGPPPSDVATRVRRLGLLLQRVRPRPPSDPPAVPD